MVIMQLQATNKWLVILEIWWIIKGSGAQEHTINWLKT